MTKDFRGKDYKCASCGTTERKLWREYNTIASVNELLCATCIAPMHAAYEAKRDPRIREMTAGDDPTLTPEGHFVFGGRGDQLCGSRVPAIPTPDGETFWGYSSCEADDIRWWYRRPTHADPELDALAVENLIAKHLEYEIHASDRVVEVWRRCEAAAHVIRAELAYPAMPLFRDVPDATNRYDVLDAILEAEFARGKLTARLYDDLYDLEWKRDRAIYYVTKPCTVTIWGTKVTPLGDGKHVLRSGEEQPRELNIGDRISIVHTRMGDWIAHLVTKGDPDDKKHAWSIVDNDGDGSALIARLATEQAISTNPPA